MTKKSFDNCDSIMSYWETFKLETLNQKISRMVLGVPNCFSRLATLGELGRFPLFVKGLSHVLKYYANISKSDGNGSLIGLTIREMKNVENPNITTWFSRVEIKTILGIKYSKFLKIDVIQQIIKKQKLCAADAKLGLVEIILSLCWWWGVFLLVGLI